MEIISQLNDRELSIIIWLVIFVIWCLTNKNVNKSALTVIKTFFNIKFFYAYILMFLYIILIIYPFYLAGVWGIFWLKNTVLWVVCVAYVMLFRFFGATDPNFINKSIKDNFKILVILEFIINIYVFNFWIELFLVPFTGVIGLMVAIAESDAKYKPVKTLLNTIISIMGLIFIVYSIYQITHDLDGFLSKSTLIDLTLPICLTIMFLPFIYLIALYANYEKLFFRMPFFIKDKDVLSYSKFKILYEFNFNLSQLTRWSNYFNFCKISNKKDIDDSIKKFKGNEK
jgi:hypothetical protein